MIEKDALNVILDELDVLFGVEPEKVIANETEV